MCLIAVYVNKFDKLASMNIMIFLLSFKRRHVFIRFRFAFCHKFQIWNSPENITFLQQKICIVSVLQIATLEEVNFFVLAFNLMLKLHLFESNHEARLFKTYRKELAKSLNLNFSLLGI